MTNREAIIAAIGVIGWQDSSICKAMIDFAITPGLVYVAASGVVINKAALQVLKEMLAMSAIQEGNFDIQYSTEGIKARIKDLEDQLGLTAQPKIRNKSFVW